MHRQSSGKEVGVRVWARRLPTCVKVPKLAINDVKCLVAEVQENLHGGRQNTGGWVGGWVGAWVGRWWWRGLREGKLGADWQTHVCGVGEHDSKSI